MKKHQVRQLKTMSYFTVPIFHKQINSLCSNVSLSFKHQNELATFNESEKADRNEWERIAQHKMEEEWKSREVILKQKFKEERDEELDRAVARLEQEVTKGRKEVEQEYQERIR